MVHDPNIDVVGLSFSTPIKVMMGTVPGDVIGKEAGSFALSNWLKLAATREVW
jgi:hypothetical protein